jgi:hypothetical protein
MLAFVDLIHALPSRGRKVHNLCFQGEFCIKGGKIGRNAFVQGELAFMHVGALFFFSCSLNWLLVCVVNALIKGEIEDRSIQGPVDGLYWL